MAEVKWTQQAADDLESITNFIAKDSVHYASLFAVDIIEAVERLDTFSRAGRIVLEKNKPAIREIIFGNYRIIYRLKNEAVEILTIYHGSRLLDPSKMKE